MTDIWYQNPDTLILLIGLFIIAATTYAAFKQKEFMVLAGFGWTSVALLIIQPIHYTMALIGMGVGFTFLFWGVYRYYK